jgi:anti-sigma B factor antagonist
MTAEPLEANVRHQQEIAIVDLRGVIDGFAQNALSSAYAEAERLQRKAILLNFGGVSFINSTGIALIITLLSQARAAGRRVLACGLSDHYAEIFAITRLTDYMELFPDETSALRNASGH